MSLIEMVGRGFGGILPFIAAGFVLMFVFRLIHDRITPFDDQAEMKAGNVAVGLNRAGGYLGVWIAISGSLILSEESYWTDLGMFLLDGVIAIGVFTIAAYVFDWIILPRINNAGEVAGGNKAVGLLEACIYVSLGFIMCGSFAGGGANLLTGILSAVAFGLTGLATLMVVWLGYNLVWRKIDPKCSIDRYVAEDKLGAAIDAGSLLLAMGVTIMFSIIGDFSGWGQDFLSYAIAVVASMLAVTVGRVIASLTLTRGTSFNKAGEHHGNLAKSLTIGFVSIGVGLLSGLVTFA